MERRTQPPPPQAYEAQLHQRELERKSEARRVDRLKVRLQVLIQQQRQPATEKLIKLPEPVR